MSSVGAAKIAEYPFFGATLEGEVGAGQHGVIGVGQDASFRTAKNDTGIVEKNGAESAMRGLNAELTRHFMEYRMDGSG